MGLWRITKDGATIGHVATVDEKASGVAHALRVAELWGIIPMDSANLQHDAVWVPDDAIENEARQRIRLTPNLAAHEEMLISLAKREGHPVDVLDYLQWLVWGNAGGIEHWIVGNTTRTTV